MYMYMYMYMYRLFMYSEYDVHVCRRWPLSDYTQRLIWWVMVGR